MFFAAGERPEVAPCPDCGAEAQYRISMPNITGKASFLDGHKRKGWADLKEANKLVREAASSKKDTAKEIRQEIKKLKVRVEK